MDEQGVIEATRTALGEHEFAVAWAEGESLTLEQVSAASRATVYSERTTYPLAQDRFPHLAFVACGVALSDPLEEAAHGTCQPW